MFSGYIPTSQILQLFGMSSYTSTAKEQFRVYCLNHVGDAYPIMGVSEFRCQYAPENIEIPKLNANFVEMEAVGLIRPTLHYVGGKSDPVDITLCISDSYEGPPHSNVGWDGNIIPLDFANLYEVEDWFYSLARPVLDWGKPPFVRVMFGQRARTGVVTSVQATEISNYPDGVPRIVNITFTLKPDIILVTNECSFFEVG